MYESDTDTQLAAVLRELDATAEARFSSDIASGIAEQWLAKARTKAQALEVQPLEIQPDAGSVASLGARTRRGLRITRRNTSLAALAGITATAAFVLLKPSQPNISTSHSTNSAYNTAIGEQSVITLPDGSTMTLAPRTSARLIDFDGKSRTVALNGEAYFDVVPMPERPFIVQAGATRTQVLGTTFNIRAHEGSGATRIAVTSGKIAVSVTGYHGEPLVLSAGTGVSVTDSAITSLPSGDALRDARWTAGELIFRNAPARDVLRALTNWFGYQFHAADSSLVTQRITASFSTRSATTALSTLQLVFDADLSVKNKTVTLTPKAQAIPTRRETTPQPIAHEVGR